jgi:hypothetical protein
MPLGQSSLPGVLYPTTLFSKPSPAYITSGSLSELIGQALGAVSKSERVTAVRSLYHGAVEALPKAKRRKQMTTRFGFFEHAFCKFGVLLSLNRLQH